MRKALVVSATTALLLGLLAVAPVSARSDRLKVVLGRSTTTPSFVTGIETAPRAGSPADVARSYLRDNAGRYGISDTDNDLEVLAVARKGARAMVRFGQRYQGVEVFGAQYLVHMVKEDGGYAVTSTNGHYFTNINTSTTPRFDAAAAKHLTIARARRNIKVSKVDSHPLTILPDGNGALAYHFTVWGSKLRGGPVKYEMFLNARTGGIAFMFDNLQHDTIQGEDSHGDLVPLEVTPTGAASTWELKDQSRSMFATGGGEITTHDVRGDLDYTGTDANMVVASPDPFTGDPSASEAHWGAGVTYDFYESLERTSINGNPLEPLTIKSSVHFEVVPGEGYCNAFWDGTQMTYGDCLLAENETYPLTADLDIVGHELTHGVTQYTANLVYANQSGAMNEGISDYFGNAIDANTNSPDLSDPTAGYLAEDMCQSGTPPPPIVTPSGWHCPERDLNDGRTIDDFIYYLIDFDNGGVHLNSTIYAGVLWDFREALYATDGQVGSDRSDAYVYKALADFMTPLDDFVDGRNALIEAITEAGLPTMADDLATANAAFDGKGIVVGWDTGTGNDATILVEDVLPVGFLISPPQVSGRRFIIGDYGDKEQACCVAEQIFVGNTSLPVDYTKVSFDQADTLNDETPDLGGRQAVWAHLRAAPSGALDFDINGRKIGTNKKQHLAGGKGFQWFPSISGQLLAWEDTRRGGDIYARKIGGKTRKLTGAGLQISAQVQGNWIVWQDFKGGTNIGMYNWKTKKTKTIRASGTHVFGPPGTGPGYVYWYDDVDGSDGFGAIRRARFGSSTVETVVKENDPNSPWWFGNTGQLIPSANKKYVTYYDEWAFLGGPGGSIVDSREIGRDVWIVKTSGGSPQKITQNIGEQAYPAALPGKARKAMWIDSSQGHPDLMRN